MLGREPVIWLAALRAVIVLATAFGLQLSPEQTIAIYAAAEAVIAVITRQVVTPTRKIPPAAGAGMLVLLLTLGGCTQQHLSKIEDATMAGRQLCEWANSHVAAFGGSPELERVLIVCQTDVTVREIACAYAGSCDATAEKDAALGF